ncbi:MAG TPA: deoxyribonuclease IV [Gemmatimonadaceae bacterium]|nr:deoxyribonuclease IV [Gemmatimonadaceae bacterium]
MTRLLGAHTIDNGGIDMAALRAGQGGMTALQIFTAIPKYYGERTSVRPERAARFRDALARAGIAPRAVIAHAAYVVNVASADETKWTRAAAALAKELERSTALGLGGVCFHPGAATGGDRDAAIARVAHAMAGALESVHGAGDGEGEGETRLLVENTAGAGSTVGRTAEEVGAMLSSLPAPLRARAGYGLDTCHLFASGHDIAASPAALTAVLDAFEEATGEPPAFFHLNDSEGALGSNRDRHALIGEGALGIEPFRWLLHDRRSAGVPLILETPQQHPDVAPDDPTPDPYDVRMMALLRSLAE